MVDDQDEVDEFEFEFEDEFEDYESLKDRVRRGPILGVLLGTTLFGGAVWVVLNSINHIRQANLIRQASVYPDIFSSESENELWVWMQAASGIAHAVFWLRLVPTSCCGSLSARNPAEDRRLSVFSPEYVRHLAVYGSALGRRLQQAVGVSDGSRQPTCASTATRCPRTPTTATPITLRPRTSQDRLAGMSRSWAAA